MLCDSQMLRAVLMSIVISLAIVNSALAERATTLPSTTDPQPQPTTFPTETSSTERVRERQVPEPDPGYYGASIQGLTGLFHIVTTDINSKHSLRLSVGTEFFSGTNFLVVNDRNRRLSGTLAFAYTPWRHLELFVNMQSQSNENMRQDEPDRRDPTVILSLGDVSFGAKVQLPIDPLTNIGAFIATRIMSSVGGSTANGSATSVNVGLMLSHTVPPQLKLPTRIHLNFSFFVDKSHRLTRFEDHSLASLHVEKFALGIRPPRVQAKLGLEFPLRRWIKIGFSPFLELNVDIATGSSDPDFNNPKFVGEGKPLSEQDLEGRPSLWTALGLQINPLRGLSLKAGADLGLISPGFGFGPPLMPWNFIVVVSYAIDLLRPVRIVEREKIIVKSVTRIVEAKQPTSKPVIAAIPTETPFLGRVLDAKTLQPLEGAIITFPGKSVNDLASISDGTFMTYGFPSGKLTLLVRHAGHEPLSVDVDHPHTAKGPFDIKLNPLAPKLGLLIGAIVDGAGNPLTKTQLILSGPETRTVDGDATGQFRIELKSGNYTAEARADGYQSQSLSFVISDEKPFSFRITLNMATPPKSSGLVKITRDKITIRKKVHFVTASANLTPDSMQLLDEVALVLSVHPEITKIRIEGHTDNRGNPQRNVSLSQSRAESVRSYLIQAGVAESRLVAKGYGDQQPKVPNFTARNRAINRRVEFTILERDR